MGWKMQDGGHFVWASVSKSLWLLISLWWTTRTYLLNLEGEASGTYTHDDAMKRHFPHYWLLVWRIDWSLVDSSHKRTVVGSYDILLVSSLVKLLNTESHITYNVTVLPFPSTGQVRWFFVMPWLITPTDILATAKVRLLRCMVYTRHIRIKIPDFSITKMHLKKCLRNSEAR